jgi:hypothetical protein
MCESVRWTQRVLAFVAGFTFNFGASNIGGAGGNGTAEMSKPSEEFQFNFNKKTSSKSFFHLF